ncbi:hypothetical protein N9Z18_01900 [Verrucomicrobiales bacterium]|nr:hypothetical protein [Verrucomicrobiales bacterium]MDB4358976.1 hypothetical protein [Verrucomicrobiales bacterium]
MIQEKPDHASPELNADETTDETNLEVDPKPVPELDVEPEPKVVTPSQILEIVSKLQRGESDEAAILINEALETPR